MDWKGFWDDRAKAGGDANAQVGRLGGKGAIDEALLVEIASDVSEQLGLEPSHRLLDVCCGNGMLTRLLSARCAQVTGIDISSRQIENAKRLNPDPAIAYLEGDASRVTEVTSGPFDRINLYFSFQYLDTYAKGESAISEMVKVLEPGGVIFIGDVPDADKLSVFFPEWTERLKHRLQSWVGRAPMGKFWAGDEIAKIAGSLGFESTQRRQPSHFPYAHYRVDYLLTPEGA